MKFSEQWLREWANPPLDTEALVQQLSVSGLEVDTCEPVAPPLDGVVVAEVIEAVQHPDADRLRLCTVRFGAEEPVEVVCGAPNARAGVKYPFAQIGTKLPGGIKIRRSKIRGVTSNGMLCSAVELGLGEESDGILELDAKAPVGEALAAHLALGDHAIDVELTPNRGDCLGVAGVAREVGVLNRIPVQAPVIEAVPATVEDVFPIVLEAPAACPRYLGRVIKNIDPDARTPLWMTERLRRSGIRAISPTVDITNYVMLELGQPMHAFDLTRLEGGIRVRYAREGETLELLDGRVIEVPPDVLVIADERQAVALGGIMGGELSGVADGTRDLFLECAFFAPLDIAGKARRFGLHTDASHRYERGVDPELQRRATERATALLLEIVGGEAGPIVEAVAPEHLPTRPSIALRAARITRLLGRSIPDADVEDVLGRLGMTVEAHGDTWQVTPPSYRFDIAIEADLIEEVARIIGFDQMPSLSVEAISNVQPEAENRVAVARMREALVDRGYQEAITFSFVDARAQSAFESAAASLALANPIASDLGVMRTTLFPGLLKAVLHNLNRQSERVRLFETGLRFRVEAGVLEQERVIAGAVLGPVSPPQWGAPDTPADFFDVKADLEALFALTGGPDEFEFEAAERQGLHPGQTAAIRRNDALVGYLGALHPALAREHKLPAPLLLFELALEPLEQGYVPTFSSLSRYPAIRRDLSLLFDDAVSAAQLEKCVGQAGPDVLKNLELFDVYRGEGIDSGRKSMSLGLIFQADSRTLNDDEIDMAVEAIVSALESQLGAVLRS